MHTHACTSCPSLLVGSDWTLGARLLEGRLGCCSITPISHSDLHDSVSQNNVFHRAWRNIICSWPSFRGWSCVPYLRHVMHVMSVAFTRLAIPQGLHVFMQTLQTFLHPPLTSLLCNKRSLKVQGDNTSMRPRHGA